MQLGQIQPKKIEASQLNAEKAEDAFEKWLRFPWMGLRPDLLLHKGAPDESGKETYVLEDPVRGEHFELGESEAKLFLCLAAEKDLKAAVDRLMKTSSLRPGAKDVLAFVNMLQMQRLAILPEDADMSCGCGPKPEPEEEEKKEKKKRGRIATYFIDIFWIITFPIRLWWWWIQAARGGDLTEWRKNKPGLFGGKVEHKDGQQQQQQSAGTEPGFSLSNIYFFRVPIMRPDKFLTAAYPWVSVLWSKPFLYTYGVMGLAGLLSMIQQFELYLYTASYLFTVKGFLIFMLCMGFLKVLHEFGHAFAAKHYGIFVRRMGLYFMFFMPMLYTDATDAWKLPSRKARMMVGLGGVLVEIYVGAMALFFWSVLPDGILRSIMFYTSGAAIISTVLVNISPFMRFDGYYVMMDYLGMSNLRSRSVMMYKYYLRKVLVDWTGPKPEEHPRGPMMAVFGMGCNLYLLVVIFGIQVMVYTEIDELIAIWSMIILFLVFIAGPLVQEITFLFKNWKNWGSKKALGLRFVVLALLSVFLFVPMRKSEMVPAFFLYQDVMRLETPGRGKIVTDMPKLDTPVQKGDLLLQIRDDRLEQEFKMSQYALLQIEETLKNMGAGGEQGGYRTWLLAERERLTAACEKLHQAIAQLEIRSPILGRITEVSKMLQKGAYVMKKEYVMTVADERFSEVQAYIPEKLYRSLKGKEEELIASLDIIVPDMVAGDIKGKFREMLDFPVTEFPNNSLFDFADGPIVTSLESRPSKSGSLQSRDPQFPIFFDISDVPEYLRHGTPCFVRIKGDADSIMRKLLREGWRIMATRKIISTFQSED